MEMVALQISSTKKSSFFLKKTDGLVIKQDCGQGRIQDFAREGAITCPVGVLLKRSSGAKPSDQNGGSGRRYHPGPRPIFAIEPVKNHIFTVKMAVLHKNRAAGDFVYKQRKRVDLRGLLVWGVRGMTPLDPPLIADRGPTLRDHS